MDNFTRFWRLLPVWAWAFGPLDSGRVGSARLSPLTMHCVSAPRSTSSNKCRRVLFLSIGFLPPLPCPPRSIAAAGPAPSSIVPPFVFLAQLSQVPRAVAPRVCWVRRPKVSAPPPHSHLAACHCESPPARGPVRRPRRPDPCASLRFSPSLRLQVG